MQVRKNQQIHTFVIVQASNSVGDFNLYLEVKIIQNAYIKKGILLGKKMEDYNKYSTNFNKQNIPTVKLLME